jgi:hypothetical protein
MVKQPRVSASTTTSSIPEQVWRDGRELLIEVPALNQIDRHRQQAADVACRPPATCSAQHRETPAARKFVERAMHHAATTRLV